MGLAGSEETREDVNCMREVSLDHLNAAAANRHGYILCLACQDGEQSKRMADDLGSIIDELFRRLQEHENATPQAE